jgi:uncharacterized protein YjbI with pentapeptide repeats
LRIFISFASKDRETVRRFEAALRGRRPEMSCFLDERGLTGGVYWIPKLGEELGKANVVLLLLGTSIGAWQELEYYEALQLSRQRNGRPRIIPVVIADRPTPGLAFLATLHQIFALELTSAPALLAIENALSAIPAKEVMEPWRRFQPYTGLPALTERDAAFFFGRDKETAELLDLLARARGRIVTLIGQSGVGKSSLVMAGVLSRLKSQLWPIEGAAWPAGLKDSRSYLQLTMRPGPDPVKELAVALVKLYRSMDESGEIEKEATDWTARFREGSRLRDMLRLTRDRIAEQQGGYPPKRFVLYVDQGEELYTRAPKDEARLFSGLLADAAEDRDTFSVLLSLRSDFYTDFQNDAAIFDLSEKFDVLPLTRDVLIDVIRRPAEVLGARFEDANLPRLIAEATQREPGALPLLSDLLQEMWISMLSRGDGVLRWSDQPGIVDISLPLKRRADAFLELPTTDPDVVRRLFTLRLAQVAQVGEPVRRRALKSECTPAEWSVAEQLAGSDQRLLTISNPLLGGEPIVEVAHEQLLLSWPTLKGWLEEQREFLIWRTETEQAATEHRKLPLGKRPEAVLMGLRLTTSESWFTQRADDLAPELRDYVKASIARRDEMLDRQKREDAQKLETERRLKEAELDRERLARTAAEEKASAALKRFRFRVAAAIVTMGLFGLFGFSSKYLFDRWAAAKEEAEAATLVLVAISTNNAQLKEESIRKLASFDKPLMFKSQSLEGLDLKKLYAGSKVPAIADFFQSAIVKVDFAGANLTYASFSQSRIGDVKFTNAELSSARFDDAVITKTDFSGAILYRAMFDRAQFNGINNFSNTDLRSASFRDVAINGNLIFTDTAWWLAFGWTLPQMEKFAAQYGDLNIEKAKIFNKDIIARKKEVDNALSPEDRVRALNEVAWTYAIYGADLKMAKEYAKRPWRNSGRSRQSRENRKFGWPKVARILQIRRLTSCCKKATRQRP